jgi:hypothetical protein
MANNHSELEKRLWDAAADLRANSKLKSVVDSIEKDLFAALLSSLEGIDTFRTIAIIIRASA